MLFIDSFICSHRNPQKPCKQLLSETRVVFILNLHNQLHPVLIPKEENPNLLVKVVLFIVILKVNDFVAEEASHKSVSKEELEAVPVPSFDKVKLEESCIIVNSSELQSLSNESGERRSYKV